mgnify:CR=1 FL=1
MSFKKIQRLPDVQVSKRLAKAYEKLEGLIEALGKIELPADQEADINERIDLINSFEGTNRELIKMLKKTRSDIVKVIEKELNYVPKNHYQTQWMVFGMMAGLLMSSVFGGLGFGVGSSGGVGIGLAVGMAIGITLGAAMDKRVEKEGRQLDVSV